MIKIEHNMLTKFLKVKTLIFLGFDTKDAFVFIIDYYKTLHKLGFMEKHGVDFVTL